MGYSGRMFNNNKGEKIMEDRHEDTNKLLKKIREKTITLDQAFFGEQKFTLEEYQKRWRGHPQEIWAFLVDHGTVEEMKLGEKLVELFPKVVEKAFNHFYEEQNVKERNRRI